MRDKHIEWTETGIKCPSELFADMCLWSYSLNLTHLPFQVCSPSIAYFLQYLHPSVCSHPLIREMIYYLPSRFGYIKIMLRYLIYYIQINSVISLYRVYIYLLHDYRGCHAPCNRTYKCPIPFQI